MMNKAIFYNYPILTMYLFMSKYLMYLSTKEQLKAEIEKQKNIFYAQHPQLKEE